MKTNYEKLMKINYEKLLIFYLPFTLVGMTWLPEPAGTKKKFHFPLRVSGKVVILQAVGRGNGMKNELIIKT